MLTRYLRRLGDVLLTPVARLLLRLHVTPDAVTVAGTLAVVAVALFVIGRGHFVAGAIALAALVLADTVDGMMARMLAQRGVRRAPGWGAFLDSTLDRVADGAIFAGLVIWFTGAGDHRATALAALASLVLGSVVPYARARAEGLGLTATVGIAERADRLILVLVGMGVHGLGAPVWVLTVVLVVLAVASGVTVVQRMVAVYRQARTGVTPDPRSDSGSSPDSGVVPGHHG